ncbi:hypothetical protein [Pseudomonas sp. FEN]|uniref:hypothetical protein n=1 Tax=Pseudomonas sp. FEN TaxID=2767468 RepID=UPI00174CD9BF|nr:hypothetical protein [Pseudomonas sp. FEN]CAD5204134.1 hypothetical protein [Pseudomonas sp. FEN]
MSIKIKEAVQIAIDNVIELFSVQDISNVLLEEVARDSNENYLITVGFERPNLNKGRAALGAGIAALMATQRAYKVVCIDKESGDALWIKDRMLEKK